MNDQPETQPLRRCFSTLGCADLPLPEISALAGEFRIPGIELRGIGERMDMPEYCAAQGLGPTRLGEICRRHHTRPVVAGSAVKLASASEQDRKELLAFCAWADAWGIPYVRVFGGGSWDQPLTEAEWLCATELVDWWRKERVSRGWRVELLLETHDAFSGSAPCLRLNQRLTEPLRLIWDSHHTWRVGGEALETTWERLGPLIRHVHLKDSVDRPSPRHPYTYVLPGDGQMPMAEVIALLKRNRFDGFVSLEWERAWHPYLPPLREALQRLQDVNWYESRVVEKPAATVACGASVNGAVSSMADPYGWWSGAAESLLRPLAALMSPGKADLPLRGQASNHGRQADRLESFARPCLLAAHWLASEPAPKEKLARKEIAEWFRRGIVIGTNPASPEFWGTTANHHQHTVEMAGLTLALQIARSDLWEPLTGTEREQVARWLASIRGAGLHRNNHMFFNVMTLAFLAQEGHGRRADEPVMRHLLDVIESMALGGGWFIDGMNETVDYYQAYAFHYYGAWWSKLYGHTDCSRAQRWLNWLGQFLKDYIHFFAASGENPPFGRSMCYRFAASAPFALAEHCGVSAIPPGQARRACTQNLRFFLSRPILQEQGALSLGWTDEFPALAEAYSCAGSAYWAAKGFAPLLLPRQHAFWQMPEKPLPAEETGFEIAIAIPQAGLVVRSHGGEVEVLNSAHGITVGNLKFGAWKWGKLSFRSGVGGEIPSAENFAPTDAALTAEFRDGSVCGRHQCQPIVVSPTHCASAYGLGDRFSQNHVSVETRLWWKAGWQLHWHHIQAHQAARLRLGTFSLPLSDPDAAEVELADRFGLARAGDRGIAVQSLRGFELVRRQDSNPRLRTHLLTWHSLLLLAQTGWVTGEHELLALTWVGEPSEEALPWSVSSSEPGQLALQHALLGSWIIESPELPLCSSLGTTPGDPAPAHKAQTKDHVSLQP